MAMNNTSANAPSDLQVPRPVQGIGPLSDPTIELRPMGGSDRPQVLALLRRALGPGSRAGSSDYWTWKHEQNPFGPSPCLVAEVDGSIIGLRAFLRWELQWRGRTIRAVRAVDTATHPDWQRQGIFSRLTRGLLAECEEQGVGLVFNTPNERSRPGYLKMGWRTVGRPTLLVRMRNPLRVAATLLRRSNTTGSFDGGLVPGFPTVAEMLATVDIDQFVGVDRDSAARASVAESDPLAPMATSSSPDYLTWRYREVPGVSYSACWDDRHPGAALIFSLKERAGLRELSISEVLVASESNMVQAARLLRRLWRQTDADYALAVAAPATTARSALRRALFLPVPGRGPVLCARPLAAFPAASEAFELQNWRLSLGDLELF